jgi:hypothetical protein
MFLEFRTTTQTCTRCAQPIKKQKQKKNRERERDGDGIGPQTETNLVKQSRQEY